MANKMLVDRTNSTQDLNRDVCFCVQCAMLSGVIDKVQLAHVTGVGNAVCCVCETPIAHLPEPPVYPVKVHMHIDVELDLEASSWVEAQAWILLAFKNQGVEVTQWEWGPGERTVHAYWRNFI